MKPEERLIKVLADLERHGGKGTVGDIKRASGLSRVENLVDRMIGRRLLQRVARNSYALTDKGRQR